MFSIQQRTTAGFQLVELKDDQSGTIASIIPACGGILHSFSVKHAGGEINVIDNYGAPGDFKEVEAGGFKGCKLSPFVCRLKNGTYHFGQADYKIEKFYLGRHAIHGLIYDSVFDVEELVADDRSATLTMRHQYRANDKGYPFDYDCMLSYKLTSDNQLSISTTILNKDKGIIPISDGWHPYFSFGDGVDHLQLEFQSKEMLEFDDELLPTGKMIPYQAFGSLKQIGSTTLDNCFTVNFAECQPMLVLRDPGKSLQLEIIPRRSYPYLQIYTPPHRKSIAIENLSAAPDAFNNGIGLQTLAPGASAEFSTTYKLTATAS